MCGAWSLLRGVLSRVFTVYARFAQSVWRSAWSKAKVPRAGAQRVGSILGYGSGTRIAKRMAATRNAGAERSWGEALRIVVGRVKQTNPARLFFAAFADRCGGVLSVRAFRAILFTQL